jgi:16S rRNA (guanine1207-N2)-methyltransferase
LDDVDRTLELATDRGVFSGSGIDRGTELLLKFGPRPHPRASGDFLDLGCGYGPIACAIAARAPDARVWAVDVNERARELCEANAKANGLGVLAVAPEHMSESVRFDSIWSNPPIRIGRRALEELLETWLARLNKHGAAYLVVQRHLGADSLAKWLGDTGWTVTRLRSKQGYRLLSVTQ